MVLVQKVHHQKHFIDELRCESAFELGSASFAAKVFTTGTADCIALHAASIARTNRVTSLRYRHR